MKNLYFFLFLFSISITPGLQAQQLFTENFNYTATQALTANGWIQNGIINTSPVSVSTAGLSFSGYVLSQVGNAATLGTTGQDIFKEANTSVTAGNLYVSFMMNITSAQAGGDYFAAFLPANNPNGYVGRVYAKLLSNGYFKLGVGKGGEPAVYGSDSFEIGITSLVVLKYQFISGVSNDSVYLYNFTGTLPVVEPNSSVASTVGAGAPGDAVSLSRIALRQGGTTIAPALTIDGIRMATNWADLNSATIPDPSTSFTFTPTGLTSANLNWIKAVNYSNAGETQLIFIKPLLPISNGFNNRNPSGIVADTNFSGIGSTYQNDALAKCIYKGDSNKVSVSGLASGTTYFVEIFSVSITDTLYSTGTFTSGITNSAGPSFVTGLIFTSGTATTASITWIKSGSYRNQDFTTLLFLKEGTTIGAGVPGKNPALITTNADFNGSASLYQFDSNAKCVFKGDTNTVTVTNLKPSTLYYLINFVVSDTDSLYSNPANASGITKMATPAGAANPVFMGLTGTIARISWVKPLGYLNANYSTLVFVKQIDPITLGVPTRNPARYAAISVTGNGSGYQNDLAANCVFRADTNFVNISGLTANKNYYVLILIVRDFDSTYSPETLVNGMSLGPAAYYDIAQINQTNTVTGAVDSNNVRATLRGIVYGVNLRTSPGIQFLLRDHTGGILVLNQAKDYFYKVSEGDSIEVQGVITQNRGWSAISTLDTIIYLGSGNAIKQPALVTALNESTENDLIRINNLNFVTPITFWPPNSTIVKAYRTGTTDTFNIRTYTTTSLSGTLAPSGEFSVVGIGAQSSSSAIAPYAFNGYQVIPLKATDIIYTPDPLSPFFLVIPSPNAVISLKGDTTLSLSVAFTKSVPGNGSSIPSYRFLLDYPTGSFTSPLASILLNGGSGDTTASLLYTLLAANLPALKYGDSILLKWTIKATSANYSRFALQTRSITFKRGAFTGISELELDKVIILSPNPTQDAFVIQSPVQPTLVQIYDIAGKLVQIFAPADLYKIDGLPKGLYFVKVQIGAQYIVKKIILGY